MFIYLCIYYRNKHLNICMVVWYALIFWLKQKQSADLGIYLVSMSLRPINLCVPLVSSLQRSATPPQQLQ